MHTLSRPATQQQEGNARNKKGQKNQKERTEERGALLPDGLFVLIQPVSIRVRIVFLFLLCFKAAVTADADALRAHDLAVEGGGVVIAVAVNGQQPAEAHGKTRWQGDILEIDEQQRDVPVPGIVQFVQTVGGGQIGLRDERDQITAVFYRLGNVLIPFRRGDDALVVPDAKARGLQPADGLRGGIGVAVGIAEKQIGLRPLIGGERTVFK